MNSNLIDPFWFSETRSGGQLHWNGNKCDFKGGGELLFLIGLALFWFSWSECLFVFVSERCPDWGADSGECWEQETQWVADNHVWELHRVEEPVNRAYEQEFEFGGWK